MADRSLGVAQAMRIAALMVSVLGLSIFLNLLFCTPASAITLPGHAGQCPVLHIGSNSKSCIATLQGLLNKANVRPVLAVDGNFGPRTFANVESFQSSRQLTVDGRVGTATAHALELFTQNSGTRNRPQTVRPHTIRPIVVKRPIIITLQDVELVGVFLLLVIIIVLLGKRARQIELTFRELFRFKFTFGLTDAELTAKTLELLVKLREIIAADAAIETYQKAAELLKAVYLANITDTRTHSLPFRWPRRMIEGHTQKR